MLQEWLHGLIAQTAAAGGDGSSGGSAFGSPIFMFVLIFVVFYFLILRPQQQQQKKQQDFISQLKKGDEVVLQTGFFAKVVEVRTDDLTVELAPNVKVRVLKSAIAGSVPAPAGTKPAESKETKGEAEKKS